jgi:hypothetical protein
MLICKKETDMKTRRLEKPDLTTHQVSTRCSTCNGRALMLALLDTEPLSSPTRVTGFTLKAEARHQHGTDYA